MHGVRLLISCIGIAAAAEAGAQSALDGCKRWEGTWTGSRTSGKLILERSGTGWVTAQEDGSMAPVQSFTRNGNKIQLITLRGNVWKLEESGRALSGYVTASQAHSRGGSDALAKLACVR